MITYEIGDLDKRLAIMWSVPYDYVQYENWFKLSVIPSDTKADQALYEDMYYNKHRITDGEVAQASAGAHEWKTPDHVLTGVMGTSGECTLNVSIRDV